jgi:hypothetical protein
MSRWKRKFVGWKHFGPAVRLILAGTLTMAQRLEQLEDSDAYQSGASCRADGRKTLCPAD